MEMKAHDVDSREKSVVNPAILNAIWDTCPDAIAVCRQSGEILWANPAATELFEFPIQALQQLNVMQFEATDGDENSFFSRAKQLESGELVVLETVFLARDGLSFPVVVRMQRIDDADTSVVLCVIRNISRLKKQDLELHQVSKLQAIGLLAGGIAHDFNNALGGIIGYAELAVEDAGENAVQKENLEKLLQAAERAKKLVKQILTFSRQNTPRRDTVALPTLIGESVEFLRSSVPSTVVIDSAISTPVVAVAGDATKIQEMLFNLATNAVSAMDESGILRIDLKKVYVSEPMHGVVGETPAGEYAVIRVEDNGCGIEPSSIHLIFEPFFSTKHPDEGNGMGLSVVFGIVRSHGGNIQLKSTPGEGTVVEVFLPVIPVASIESPVPYASSSFGNETLLVVDDEPLLVDICGKLLRSMGYQVISTMDVNEALDILQDNTVKIDALLTDQTMPQMKGAELASRAMKLRPGLPVVLCTGFSRSIDEKAAIQLGISKFIQKPVRKKELATAVREAIEQATIQK